MKSVAQHEVGVAGFPEGPEGLATLPGNFPEAEVWGWGGHVKVPGLLPLLSEEELVRDTSGHIQRGQVSG